MGCRSIGSPLTPQAMDAAKTDAFAHALDAHLRVIVVDEPIGGTPVEEVVALMTQPLTWADGLPLDADGNECGFYMKD